MGLAVSVTVEENLPPKDGTPTEIVLSALGTVLLSILGGKDLSSVPAVVELDARDLPTMQYRIQATSTKINNALPAKMPAKLP